MIVRSLQAIIRQFEEANSFSGDVPMKMTLGNVGFYEDLSNADKESIIVSIVNFEEDKVLKNGAFNTVVGNDMIRHNPLIHLNLYILFSAVNSNYSHALIQIRSVLTFFQGRNVFDNQNTVFNDDRVEKLIFDLYPMTFEQTNHLWGVLGGKQYPAVIYKVRLISINAGEGDNEGIIEAITDSTSVL